MEIVKIIDGKPNVKYTGYDLYLKKLVEYTEKKFGKIYKDKGFADALHNHLFGLEGSKKKDKKWTREDIIFSKIFYGFTEIMDSFETLQDSEVYVKQYPNYQSFRKRKITRARYLRYHIEKYLEEVYILKTRLEAYANMIKKFLKHDLKTTAKIDKIKKIIFTSIEGIIETRSSHAHARRYTDQKLDRLSSLELFCIREKDNFPLVVYSRKMVYPSLRKEWAKRIRSNNEEMKKLLDFYFDMMVKIVFTKQGTLRIT